MKPLRRNLLVALWLFSLATGALSQGSDQKHTPQPGTRVFAGGSHILIIRPDGKLWFFGTYPHHENSTEDQAIDFLLHSSLRQAKLSLVNSNKWQLVGLGSFHTLGLSVDGELWSWGQSYTGALGLGTSKMQTQVPLRVGRNRKWREIAAGSSTSFAIAADGSLWGWGENKSAQLGDGTLEARFKPVEVIEKGPWSAVSAGPYHTLAVKADGTLWAWGANDFGELGIGSHEKNQQPRLVDAGKDWVVVSTGGFHSAGVKKDGTLWTWGHNNHGQLGNGDFIDSLIPKRVGAATNWVTVTSGNSHCVALKGDGSTWAWGWNKYGQLGTGAASSTNEPVRIMTDQRWVSVSADTFYTVASTPDGSIWFCGTFTPDNKRPLVLTPKKILDNNDFVIKLGE